MINFDCKKCIHFSVCKFMNDALSEIEAYNNRIGENETFKINLECKYFATEGLEFIKRK